jgi:RNA polymerase sigma-70 factor (ECF subfamily)
MDQAERQAIAACQTGELTHFNFLYERYLEKIYRFVYFKTWHRQTAEDLTSVTFMKALEHIADYDVARGNFSSWLYRIAHNTVIDHYRTAKQEVDIEQVFNLASGENVAAKTEVNLALEEVKEYLKSLETETRELLIMRLWQGLSYQEISELTGKNESALKMAASRALKSLRANISPAALLLIIMNLHKLYV